MNAHFLQAFEVDQQIQANRRTENRHSRTASIRGGSANSGESEDRKSTLTSCKHPRWISKFRQRGGQKINTHNLQASEADQQIQVNWRTENSPPPSIRDGSGNSGELEDRKSTLTSCKHSRWISKFRQIGGQKINTHELQTSKVDQQIQTSWRIENPHLPTAKHPRRISKFRRIGGQKIQTYPLQNIRDGSANSGELEDRKSRLTDCKTFETDQQIQVNQRIENQHSPTASIRGGSTNSGESEDKESTLTSCNHPGWISKFRRIGGQKINTHFL
jgi:hypothetical protein